MMVRKAVISDAEKMLVLSCSIYPPEWHVPKGYIGRVMASNESVYRVLDVDGEIKGTYSMFPLRKEDYERVLRGDLDEKELPELVKEYTPGDEVWLYLISILVDVHDKERKTFSKTLIQSIPTYIEEIQEKGVTIREIGAIAISNEGEKFIESIGMDFSHALYDIEGWRAG
ncbi:hypothetical protein [Evansella clarkii]|uniref:hypothetical protein n=1 Tax=Evansella clarkii TaxID=79879 RepID=UPI00099647A6|nr:hypothetical protein [Evansella clarkii]